ncbi:hypothetical protein [Streptomyces phaeoluteigriseus]|uniref:hypothetical protein n=1 Tax=Streptomyces phaeoluteigriseus TaxID=114686 RepID=UPI001B87838D
MSGRSTRDIPDQGGRTAVVSAADGGPSPPARTLLVGALDSSRRPGGRTAVDGVAAADRGVVRRDGVTTGRAG